MKKLISMIAALALAVTATVTSFAATPGNIEDWGCDITSFFAADNTETVLTVVYQNSKTDPEGNNIGFKINQVDWEDSNAVYPFFAADGTDGEITFTITRDELLKAAEESFGKELGDILWADVRPADNSGAKVISVKYSAPEAETTAAETEAETTAAETEAETTAAGTEAETTAAETEAAPAETTVAETEATVAISAAPAETSLLLQQVTQAQALLQSLL